MSEKPPKQTKPEVVFIGPDDLDESTSSEQKNDSLQKWIPEAIRALQQDAQRFAEWSEHHAQSGWASQLHEIVARIFPGSKENGDHVVLETAWLMAACHAVASSKNGIVTNRAMLKLVDPALVATFLSECRKKKLF